VQVTGNCIWYFRTHPKGQIIADEIYGWNETYFGMFVETYWQKKPLLIRQAIPDVVNTLNLNRDNFFDLCVDKDVESRLISFQNDVWTKQYGPFSKTKLQSMGHSKWTVLIQEVDRHVPRVADLWKYFSFVPNWRRDDIMISYSTPDAGIGAHVDNYDVFLLQGR